MLTIFRRHSKECMEQHGGRDPGRKSRRCQCPIHAEGHLGGTMYRKALKTTSWTRAQEMAREKESRGSWEDPNEVPQITIGAAVQAFLAGVTAKSNGRAKSTVRKYRALFLGVNPEWANQTTRQVDEGLLDWCRTKGRMRLADLTVPVVTEFASGWNCRPHHRSKRIQLLRKFFRYCVEADWIEKNPALALEHPKLKPTPTLPFDPERLPHPGPQWKAIVEQCQDKPRLLALTLLMRYAGLRISDAATFQQSRIMADGSIFLCTGKSGEPVTVPMHPELQAALDAIVPNERGYYFWSGASAVTTATDNWRRRYQKLFQAGGIPHGHPHRFRNTFAVDLLLRGVPIDQVSVLLGHSSVKITERHYLAFVAGRRQQIAESLRRAWAQGDAA